MDYAQIYFGKPLNDITYEDIESYFVESKEENETIEFKSFNQKSSFDGDIDNIIKGIDAFLNSNGGVLIWGAPVGKKVPEKKEKIFVGELSPLNFLKEKDSLISLISGRITPLPIGIKVAILERGNNYLYVFEIQASPYKPHQFSDKYFVRLDGQSRPAPHYLIDALIKRITYPDLCGFIKFEKYSHYEDKCFIEFSVIIANFSKYLNEENSSYQLNFYPGQLVPNNGLNGFYYSKEHSVLHFGRPTFDRFNMMIDQKDLIKHAHEVKFQLVFGGKYSPAKSSRYTIDLLTALATPDGRNCNNLIKFLEENILLSDYQEKIGKNKDSFIKDILERD